MTAYLLIDRSVTPPEASRLHSLSVAAQLMGLDEAEVLHCLEEHGRADTDDYTLIPEDPNE